MFDLIWIQTQTPHQEVNALTSIVNKKWLYCSDRESEGFMNSFMDRDNSNSELEFTKYKRIANFVLLNIYKKSAYF